MNLACQSTSLLNITKSRSRSMGSTSHESSFIRRRSLCGVCSFLLAVSLSSISSSAFTRAPPRHTPRTNPLASPVWMVLNTPPSRVATDASSKRRSSSPSRNDSHDNRKQQSRRVRQKYKRKRIPETEKALTKQRKEWEQEYERIIRSADGGSPSIWSFESLFPDPVLDQKSIERDLFEVRKRDSETRKLRLVNQGLEEQQQLSLEAGRMSSSASAMKMRSSFYGGSSMMRIWREPRLSSAYLPKNDTNSASDRADDINDRVDDLTEKFLPNEEAYKNNNKGENRKVDFALTRMVEDRMYGYRRTKKGVYEYETSLMGDGAVKFRDGVRLGNPLRVNADRLTYFAKKELQHGRVEEAQELYEHALAIDPRDGRSYLGLSRCAERRRDFDRARDWLQTGITNSISVDDDMNADNGANPFLLQALGVLEEKMGHLSRAETLYMSAAKSRPSHAPAWVALAQLRTNKLGQGANAGRLCYQSAERELQKAGRPPSSHVYTAWASLEYQEAGDTKRARELYKKALDVDNRCSAAYLQLGVMEADSGNWKEAQDCFDAVLKFDQRNTRVLQAYAIMESNRPGGSSRKAIDLFERALKINPRDAGALQAYALYVERLGDIDAARELLRRGADANKRHAPIWQAWGCLEMRHGSPIEARSIFQQGIWACAQLAGGQSGGYRCARLWQAWGVLEAKQGDPAAARRCFSRALDADSRNLPTITAWAAMEEELGNISDARSIFERGLKRFAAGSQQKNSIWRSFELMEQRLGNTENAQSVYQRFMREALYTAEEQQALQEDESPSLPTVHKVNDRNENKPAFDRLLRASEEVEVVRWDGGGEVWLNDRAIEGMVPNFRKKSKKQPQNVARNRNKL